MDITLYEEIVNVMAKVQTTSSCHQKYRSVLLKIYEKSDINEFYACFEKILTHILNQDPKTRNMFVDRAAEFCSLFCASPELNENLAEMEDLSLLENVFNFLLDLHDLESDTIRYRVCQMINKLLNKVIDLNVELDEDICNKIETAMLERIENDGKSEIRFQAIAAVHCLQIPDDHDCKVISTLLSRMSGDPTAKVRKVCVQKICIRRDVLVALIKRTRDVSSEVRFAAFDKVSKFPQHLKINERQTIIRNGFLDSSPQIRNFIMSRLISSWLSNYNNDYLKFLKALRMSSTENQIERTKEIVKYVLNSLFGCRPCEEVIEVLNIKNNHMVDYKDLNWESAIYWRCLIETFQTSEKYEFHLSTILPDFVDFAKYIQNYYISKLKEAEQDDLEFEFILNELFTITQSYDISDTMSQQSLNNLVCNILYETNLNTNLIATIIKNLEKSIPKADERNKFVCEIISNIMYPIGEEDIQRTLDANVKIAQMKVELNYLNEKLALSVQDEDFESAAVYKKEMDDLKVSITKFQESLKASQVVVKKTDLETTLKCINIVRGVLISKHITTLNPVLKTLCNDFVIEQLTQTNDKLRVKAFECYGLCCIVDSITASKGIQIFSAYILASTLEGNYSDADCLQVAIKATVDLLMIYGWTLINPSENEDQPSVSLTDIVQSLVDLMDHEDMNIQVCAAQGLCNLILNRSIHSASLISRMILKWCNPADDEEDDAQELRQIIGMMLEELPKLVDAADEIQKAVLPTIKTILRAPNTNPLSEVNIQDIVKFLLAMCNMCQEATNLHSRLAVSICLDIRENPSHKFNPTLSRILLMLNLSFDDKQEMTDLINFCHELKDDISNNVVLNNITKFISNLEILNSDELSMLKEEEIEE
ncbi:hypothetical protein ILUMI_11611 [Ignelater luminosus]|uniref:Nuclear condensin complex subunit 3 C-terminal domain-containing protein n=1 Tax=Ignelater luminosus TaxID=2038154 RepID=A0A8K0CVP0_IGNLU|nr:hypothetical protein ILUMI_11611 [Ignelater luminosus]